MLSLNEMDETCEKWWEIMGKEEEWSVFIGLFCFSPFLTKSGGIPWDRLLISFLPLSHVPKGVLKSVYENTCMPVCSLAFAFVLDHAELQLAHVLIIRLTAARVWSLALAFDFVLDHVGLHVFALIASDSFAVLWYIISIIVLLGNACQGF